MKKKLFSFSLEDELKIRVKILAAKRCHSMSFILNEIIKKHLDEWEAREKQGEINDKLYGPTKAPEDLIS